MSSRIPLPVFRVCGSAMLLAAAALLHGCGADLPEAGEAAPATAVVSETVATQSLARLDRGAGHRAKRTNPSR